MRRCALLLVAFSLIVSPASAQIYHPAPMPAPMPEPTVMVPPPSTPPPPPEPMCKAHKEYDPISQTYEWKC